MKMEPARRLSSDGNSNNSQMTVLWNAVDSLTATRITERKDGIDRLLNLLRDEKVKKMLDQNQLLSRSKQSQGGGRTLLNWSQIFTSAEIAFRKEYEAGADSDRTHGRKKLIFGLLHMIISEANRDKNHPMLDPNVLLAHITRFLVHKVIPTVHGQQILDIINQFLSIPSYVSSTKGEDWSHFIKAVVTQIKKAALPLQRLFEILIKGIIYGSDHPECISVLRTWVVDLYKSVITAPAPNAFMEHPIVIMDGFLHLCKVIAVEARGILCAAGEACISNILRYPQTPAEHEKACELFVMFLKIHASSDSHGHISFWVENAAAWSDIVCSLYNYSMEEIQKLATERSQPRWRKSPLIEIPKNLHRLSVMCTKLMQLKPSDLPHVEPPAKRIKTGVDFDQVVRDALKLPPGADQLTWLIYIGSVLKEYPEILKTADYYPGLLDAGANLLTSAFLKFQELFSYLQNVLGYERFLLSNGILDEKSSLWNRVWDILVKSFPVQEPGPGSLELMEDILVYYHPLAAGSLLSSYASSLLPLTSSSLKLLQRCLLLCQVPAMPVSKPTSAPSFSSLSPVLFAGTNNDKSGLRFSIIRWLLPSCEKDLPFSNTNSSTDIDTLVPRILFSLLIPRSNQILENELKLLPVELSLKSDQFEDFEQIFFQCTFKCRGEGGQEPHQRRKSLMRGNSVNVKFSSAAGDIQAAVKPLLELLQEDLTEVSLIDVKSANLVKKLHHLIFRVELYLNLVNLTVKYKMVDINVEFKDTLLRFLDSSLSTCATYLPNFLSSQSTKLDGVYQVLKQMNRLLSIENLCEETKSFLLLSFPSALVDTFLSIVKKRFDKFGSENGHSSSSWSSDMDMDMEISGTTFLLEDGHEGQMSVAEQKELIALEALKCICSYGTIDPVERGCDLLSKILDVLGRNSGTDASQSYFELCAEFISRTWTALASVRDKQIIDQVMDLLKCMCQRYHCNFACTTRLWSVFADLTPVIRRWGEETKFMILVGNLSTLVDTQGIRSCLSYFKLMQKLAQHDPDLTWTYYLPKKAPVPSGPKYPLLELHKFLKLSSHLIRLAVIEAICSVFRSVGWVKVDPCLTEEEFMRTMVENRNLSKNDRIKLWFIQICKALDDTFHTSAHYTHAEKIEEGVNCVAVVLLCLTKMAFSNEYIEQPVLYVLMKTTTERNIVQSLACAALEQAGRLDFRKSTQLYAPVNLEIWIRSGGLQEDIPYMLFNCENKERFYVVYFREIVANLVARNEWNDLENLALGMKTTSVELIRRSFCEVFSRLIAKSLAVDGEVDQNSTEVLKRRLGGERVLQSTTRANLSALVLAIISNVLEVDICVEWDCGPSVLLPDFVSIPLSKHAVPKALEYVRTLVGNVGDLMTDEQNSGSSILLYLASTSPRSIYWILLELATRVHDAHSTHSRLWRLHHFVLFVDLMLDETSGGKQQQQFHLVSGYLCHFVIHAYLRFLNFTQKDPLLGEESDSEERFLRAVLFNMRLFIQRLIRLDSERMEEFYKLVIRRLAIIASSSTASAIQLKESIRKIFDLLIVENHRKFSIALSKLDPFPEDEFFHEYLEITSGYQPSPDGSPEDTLETIVRNAEEDDDYEGKQICTKELLSLIRELLSTNKKALAELVKNAEGKRFHDECTNDLIHRLIRMLIRIVNRPRSDVQSDQEEQVRTEAAKCLGELGPVDLSVLVLPHYGKKWSIVNSETAIPQLIKMVSSYLADEEIRVVTTTMQVMKKILEVSECSQVLEEGKLIGRRLVKFLEPFRSGSSSSSVIGMSVGGSVKNGDVKALESKLVVNGGWTFQEWIMNLTCALIDAISSTDSLLLRLKPLCCLKTEFCEEIFPFVVHTLLLTWKKDLSIRNALSHYFQNFFATFVQLSEEVAATTGNEQRIEKTEECWLLCKNKSALRTLLRSVQYLREHPIPPELTETKMPTPWDNNFWLDLNYLDVAKAAQYCDAYLTSIMFAEIYALQVTPSEGRSKHSQSSEDTRSLVGSYNLPSTEREKVEKLLVKAYIKIGECDGVYGCGSARFSDVTSEVQYLEASQAWDEVLYANDSRIGSSVGVCNAIKHLGLFNTCWTQLHGIEAQQGGYLLDEQVSDIQYECGWRLSQWNINTDKVTHIENVDLTKAGPSGTLQKFVYESLQATVKDDLFKLNQALQSGYDLVLRDLHQANLETSENLYSFLSQLQMLRVIEDMTMTSQTSEPNFKDVNKKWKIQHEYIPLADFKHQEPILSVRKVVLNALREKPSGLSPSFLTRACDRALEELVLKARQAGRLELASKYAYELSSDTEEGSIRKQVEIAKNHWAKGKVDIALHIVNSVLNRIPHEDGTNTYASLLLLHGEWLFQSLGERPSLISQKFQHASRLYEKNPRSSPEEIAKTYITLGEYADTQFQKLADYIHSDLFQQKLDHLQKSKEEQDRLKRSGPMDQDMKKTLHFMGKQWTIDRNEIENIYLETTRYRLLALQYYMKALDKSDKYDLFIFRTIALWLNKSPSDGGLMNVSPSGGNDADKKILENPIQSYKYIAVLHQLSARLGTKSKATSEVLEAILLKCAEEHPYHALPVILTQAMLHKDKELLKNKGQHQSSSSSRHSREGGGERVTAAGSLVTMLKKMKKTGPLIVKMEALWNALIGLAYYEQSRNFDRRNLPDCDLLRMRKEDLKDIPVLTVNIPVNPAGRYNILGIHEFLRTYQLVGGINAPKKITCRAVNGRLYNMLLKGNDDLRQDAVMQQVFGVMNQLLEAEPKTKKKRLLVRTYKVVPLSQRSGVIEWCENTQTFGEYLVGDTAGTTVGAHVKYRPNDYKPHECRMKMMEVKDCGDNKKKLKTFLQIMDNFKPVFHHFFFENFPDAGSFFERRLAYTRSVATSSIVGYILGLGDRHVLNILIDKKTAEVIHIDLGVAFEQGRLLPTPETIPFRLTRDVIAGMGFCGTEGVFRRSCEDTMEVLRKNADIILTILEVLLYDPLYLWTLTEDRKRKLQPIEQQASSRRSSSSLATAAPAAASPGSDSESSNKRGEQNNTAAGELRRLKCKLAGIQEGRTSGSTISVHGHVAQLINNAMDTTQLSRLFPGWQPYL